ncbi:MAG: GIY-YIG nuclease family protein [Fibrobacterales bacterium]|nr:GIY-YIG nuclease family protein [Fibrobacterales bacterium]
MARKAKRERVAGKSGGVIYILTNPSFPEYVKIGYADDLGKRLKQLNSSECIPFAFRVYAVYHVSERLGDKKVHKIIDSLNPSLRAKDHFGGKERKKEFFQMSQEEAYQMLFNIAELTGQTNCLQKLTPEGQEIEDEKQAKKDEERTTYTEQMHLNKGSTAIQKLYQLLKSKLLALDGVDMIPKKLYVSFKTKEQKSFVGVVFQKNALKVFFNMKKGTLKDPGEVTQDVSNIGHWATGDYCVALGEESDLEMAWHLFEQSYRAWNKKE